MLLLSSCEDNTVDQVDDYGNIYGFIYDYSTDEPLDNCTITLFPTIGSKRSNYDGSFYFPRVYADKYSIRVEKDGYGAYEGYVIVNTNLRTDLNIVLKQESNE